MEDVDEEGEETLEEIDESELEREVRHGTSVFMRKDDSGLEDEFEYLWEAHVSLGPDELEEDRWWSPEPPEPSSEEDEEEVRYLTEILELGPQKDKARQGESPAIAGVTTCIKAGGPTPEVPGEGEPLLTKKTKRRKPRKKVAKDNDHDWELVRQDAWLREMLTDSSGSESEEKYARFAESGRWIAEMTGIPQLATTTSRGECCGQEKPDS
jgi:hypothetical protein